MHRSLSVAFALILGLAAAPAALATTVAAQVSANNDDASEDAGGSVRLNHVDLEMGAHAWVGLRFQDVTIPPGSTVTRATVRLRAAETNSETTHLTVFGQDAGDAPSFSANAENLSSRVRTSASTAWSNVPVWTSGTWYETPDLASVIAEIVARPDWSSGNSIVILIRSDDLGGRRRSDSFVGAASAAATLQVEYAPVRLADHDLGQQPDAFSRAGSATDAELFAFNLDPGPGSSTVSTIAFRISEISGLVNGDWAGVEIVVDDDGDGSIGAEETATVGGVGVVDQAAGTIVFSTRFGVSAATNYVLRADFASLSEGDVVTIELHAADITISGPLEGTTTRATHAEASFLGDVLLVVVDSTSLDSQEASKRALIEGWGYRVVPISASAPAAEYEAAAQWVDVAYVSETITSNKLGTKLREAPFGVVNDECAQADELGFSSAYATFNDVAIDVTDTSHYITSAFSAGTLTIFDAAQPLRQLSGTPGGFSSLAERGGGTESVLAVLDPGAALHGGGTAASRRVYLPWGDSALDINRLTDDGRTLMRRAIEWCAGPVGHWKLDDASGSTAIDSIGGHDGVVNGGAWVAGPVRGALELDGDDHVAIPAADAFDITSAITIAGWVRADAWGSGGDVDVVLRRGEGNPNSWQLAVADGKVSLMLDAGDEAGFTGDTALEADRWYHVAATWDGSFVRIYVDGMLDAAPIARGGSLSTDDRNVYLGGRVLGDCLDGMLDDVRLYRRALSAKEIAALASVVPTTRMLMVVTDPTSLTVPETLRRAQFEAWSYEVTLIDESDSAAAFDVALDAADVVYVSEEISAAALGRKLLDAPIGVVIEKGACFDDFGLVATDPATLSATTVRVASYDHYIVKPFATGSLELCDTAQPMNRIIDELPGGGLVLAEWGPGGAALVAVDAGCRLDGAARAAGRRVFLPVGGGAFDWAELTDHGRTIVRRSLAWGAGLAAYWRFDESAGAVAEDLVGGHDATLVSMDPGSDWVNGRIDGGLDFDGANDAASTTLQFAPPEEATIAFWMRTPGPVTAEGRIFGLADAWEVRQVDATSAETVASGLVFDLGASGANTQFVTSVALDAPGRWYHVAAVYDSATDTYEVYIDGTLHASGSRALSVPGAGPLSIGTRTGTTECWRGTIDDLRISRLRMGADEILALYESARLRIVGWTERSPD